jgi:hypothetical protein
MIFGEDMVLGFREKLTRLSARWGEDA